MRRLLPALLLVLAACGTGDDGGNGDRASSGGHDHGASSEVAAGARVVAVTASSFAFSPSTIEAEVGEDLAVELTSEDVEHDFVIDELHAHVGAEAGETATGGFSVGDEPGEYTYYCSVPGHREAGMEGTLSVR